jgi:predicted DNA-binding ribbon-helix-helix protein
LFRGSGRWECRLGVAGRSEGLGTCDLLERRFFFKVQEAELAGRAKIGLLQLIEEKSEKGESDGNVPRCRGDQGRAGNAGEEM